MAYSIDSRFKTSPSEHGKDRSKPLRGRITRKRPGLRSCSPSRAAAILLAALVSTVSVSANGGDTHGSKGEPPWQPLFQKESLAGWREIAFEGHGNVRVADGVLTLGTGSPFTGIVSTNPVLRTNYEIELEARRDQGSDFFCGLTVPVREAYCSLIVGGWGGGVVGISNIDGLDASENETTQYLPFEQDRWYRIRFRVTAERLQVWLDKNRVIDADIRDRRISLRHGDIDRCTPLGLATWRTTGSVRNARIRRVVDGSEAR